MGFLVVLFNYSLHAADIKKEYTPQEMLFDLCEGRLKQHCIQCGINALQMANILFSWGASACARDKGFDTPLHLAAQTGAYDVAEILLRNCADPKATDLMAENPFHTAVRYNQSRFIDVLFADDKSLINIANGKGNTPLHLAAVYSNSEELVKHLIDCGASKTQKNLKNQTAEDYAREFLCEKRANLIRDYSPAEQKK